MSYSFPEVKEVLNDLKLAKNNAEVEEFGSKLLPIAVFLKPSDIKKFLKIVQSNKYILNSSFTPCVVSHVYNVTRKHLPKTHNNWTDFIYAQSFKVDFEDGTYSMYHPIYQEMVEVKPTEENLQRLVGRFR